MKYAKHDFTEWRIELIEEERIQVAYIGVICTTELQTHIHLLMLGKNRFGKTLSDVDASKWVKRWKYGIAEIEPIHSKIGSDFYIQSHMSKYKPDAWDILDFNLNLLRKSRHKEKMQNDLKLYISSCYKPDGLLSR